MLGLPLRSILILRGTKNLAPTPWYDTLNYAILDLETSVKNRGDSAIGSMAASPYHPDNKIVLGGYYPNRHGHYYIDHGIPPKAFMDDINVPHANGLLLVGHNIKFDLLYVHKYHPKIFSQMIENGIMLWDTMVVEYILTGQQVKFTSLDELSTKYGGSLKDDKIKKYWEDGVDTEDIPDEELSEYLIRDLSNTENIFRKQKVLARAYKEPSITNVIKLEMEALLDTIITEANGMYVDMNVLIQNSVLVSEKLAETERYLKVVNADINWSSTNQLKGLLFGGSVKVGTNEVELVDTDKNPIFYKSGKKKGKPKTKMVDDIRLYYGLLQPDPSSLVPKWEHEVSTDDKYLSMVEGVIIQVGTGYSVVWEDQLRLIAQLKTYRELYKDFHTYYMGIAKNVWGTDSCVHAQFNHTVTDTGRLSSSSPNLQNITGD